MAAAPTLRTAVTITTSCSCSRRCSRRRHLISYSSRYKRRHRRVSQPVEAACPLFEPPLPLRCLPHHQSHCHRRPLLRHRHPSRRLFCHLKSPSSTQPLSGCANRPSWIPPGKHSSSCAALTVPTPPPGTRARPPAGVLDQSATLLARRASSPRWHTRGSGGHHRCRCRRRHRPPRPRPPPHHRSRSTRHPSTMRTTASPSGARLRTLVRSQPHRGRTRLPPGGWFAVAALLLAHGRRGAPHRLRCARRDARRAHCDASARVALERRVAPCAALLSRLELPRFQKNWAPFAYGGQDFVVYSVLPLRIFRVEYESAVVGERREAGVAECEEVSASTPVELKERLEDCNAISRLPSHAQQQAAWRRCTGSARPLAPRLGGGCRRGARARTRIHAHPRRWHARSAACRTRRRPTPSGSSPWAGNCRTRWRRRRHPPLCRALEAARGICGADRPNAAGAGRRRRHRRRTSRRRAREWVARKLREAVPRLLVRTQAAGASSVAPSSSSRFTFELVSLSRFFTPPNSRWDHPKMVSPHRAAAAHPATLTASNSSDAVATAAAADGCASPFGCAGSTRLHMTYGELDVLGHAWSPTLREILRTLIPSDRLATRALPLWLRDGEAARRRHASTTQPNDLSAPFYASHLPVGAPRSGETKGAAARAAGGEHAVSRCRGSGFEMLWNTALHPFSRRSSARAG